MKEIDGSLLRQFLKLLKKYTIFKVAIPLNQVCDEQVFDQRLGFRIERLGKSQPSFENILIDSHWNFIAKRVYSCDHFIEQDTKSPPVHRLSMALIEKNFRAQIFRGSTESKSSILIFFDKPKVDEF